MTRRAPHPALAALYRAGASAARTAAALRRAEEKTAFAALSLEDHPLAAEPSWSELVEQPSADAQMAATLAQLAQDETSLAPVLRPEFAPGPSGISRRSPARSTEDMERSSAGSESSLAPDLTASPVSPFPRTEPAGPRAVRADQAAAMTKRRRGDGSAVGSSADEDRKIRVPPKVQGKPGPGKDQAASALHAVERAVRQYEADASGHRTSASPGEDMKSRRPVVAADLRSESEPLMSLLSEKGQAAAARPVRLDGPFARRAAVAQVLQGEDAVATPPSTGLTANDRRIAAALSRLGAATSPEPSPVARKTPSAGADVRRHSVPAEPAREPVPAPRNGIERLLLQAKRQNLVAEDQSQRTQARLASEPAPLPDVAQTVRTARDAMPAFRLDENAVAQAVTDILRREARAAGIDLKGGRS